MLRGNGAACMCSLKEHIASLFVFYLQILHIYSNGEKINLFQDLIQLVNILNFFNMQHLNVVVTL